MALTVYCYRICVLLVLGGLLPLSPAVFAQTQTDDLPSDATAPLEDGFDEKEPLDPDKPLTEFSDFGVDWPDIDGTIMDSQAEAEAVEEAESSDSAADALQDALADDRADIKGEADADTADASGFDEEAAQVADGFQPEDALARTRYDIRFSGLPENMNQAFGERFDILSVLKEYRGDDANFAQIKRRAETDRELVEQLLTIEGYYDAIVSNRFEEIDASSNDVTVVIGINSGPQYRLRNIELPGLSDAVDNDPAIFRSIFGLQPDDIINSDRIIAAVGRIDIAMAEGGYAFGQTGEPELVIDHADRGGDLTASVIPGGRYDFGRVTMANSELFGPEHVELIARFNPGDLYKASDVEDLRRALIATGLISTVTLDPVLSDQPGVVDLAVNATPAPLRTISGAIGYGTGEGARAELSWEHRNFFPPEGLLRLSGVVATQEQSGSMTFRRNNYRRRDNILNGRVALSNFDRAAFQARTLTVSANIERQSNLIYQKKWSWSAGIELLASQERDIAGQVLTTSRDTFFIGALPATVTYDATDDLLDPKSGFRLGARLSPEASLQSGSFFYIRGQIDGSAYLPVSEKIVLAGRTRLGSIAGAGNNRIAPSRRLYSGGGGSVRGYGFQSIGPRDVNNDPVGGRSLVEFSLEARVRLDAFGGNFGIVPFVDAGNVYTNQLPSFSGLRYGAGIGVRYYSNFGPIRIDVGTPINPQPGDSPVAVYVSLGQAF